MKIAIIGTGIAGNLVAYHLNKQHDISVFEANNYAGGHTHTHNISIDDETHQIDTGFIVFNQKTYPNFIKLLEELNVEYQESYMSFSVQNRQSGLEYNGTSLNSLFAQRRNFLRPSFYRMIKDILRFNRECVTLFETQNNQIGLGEYLLKNKYSTQFVNDYIVPMGAAVWSTDPKSMFQFPARFFVQFFSNHGFLNVNERPQWYVIKGGSSQYVTPLIKSHRDKIRLSSPVENIRRANNKVYIRSNGQEEMFDYVFIASHSDQAINMLQQPTQLEREVLGAIPYSKNEAVLHTDDSVLPKRKLAWAAWNYHLESEQQEQVALTYNMNILQSLQSKHTFCVSLNHHDAIDEKKIIKRINYTHPFFTREGVAAQNRHSEINGTQGVFYCGAYWRYGFHEDGVVSALQALSDFQQEVGHEKQNILWPNIA